MKINTMYFDAKPDGDPDLVMLTVELFKKYNISNKIDSFLSNHRLISAQGKTSAVQQYLLNSYWYHQVITINKDSMKVRAALIPGGTPNNWLKLFEEIVLPFAIENNLPNHES